MSYQKEREDFIRLMDQEVGMSPDHSRQVLRFANLIQQLAEVTCERNLNKNEVDEDARASRKIIGICSKYGVRAILSGDPRGACVKLEVPSGKTDDWGGTGICVPTEILSNDD